MIYGGTHNFSGATVTGIAGVTPTWDSVVAATGGDYTTLGAAITAGKTSIFVKDGTYTETGDITLPANCTIWGESMAGTIINMGTNLLTTAASTTIMNITLDFTENTTNDVQIGGSDNTFFRVHIKNSATTNPADMRALLSDGGAAVSNIHVLGCKFTLSGTAIDMGNRIGLGFSNASSRLIVDGCVFIGNSSTYEIVALRVAARYSMYTNLRFLNCGKTATNFIQTTNGTIQQWSNLFFEACVGTFDIASTANHYEISDVYSDATGFVIQLSGDSCLLSNINSVGSLTVPSGAIENFISNCVFNAGVTIGGNNNTLSSCKAGADGGAGANTITISSGANDCVIIGCKTDAAISDSGTGTILTSNSVY